jgi:cobalt-zinc-cadmium efflux system protein
MGVVFSSLVIYLKPNWVLIDPIVSILFTIITIFFSFRIFKETILILLDSTPKNIDL